MRTRTLSHLSLFTLAACVMAATASAQTTAPAQVLEAEQSPVVVENVSDQSGVLTGTVVNRSGKPVRNVELKILYSWRWRDERHPGEDNMSFSRTETLAQTIEPGQALPFRFPIVRPSDRTDGHYHVDVWIPSFSVVSVVPAGVPATTSAPPPPAAPRPAY